ncbi:MAG: TolB family protein, partial [Anaerolineales bacterium]
RRRKGKSMDLRLPNNVSRLSFVLVAFTFAMVGCSNGGSNELSFVGPEIEGIRDIRIADLREGTSRKVLPRANGLGGAFLWFPDGERAVVYRGGAAYVAEVENDLITECLTCDFDDFGSPAFAPDGRSIAWPARDGIYLQDMDGYGLEKVADLKKPGWLSWSPDSRSIAFARRNGGLTIYRLDLEDGSITPLTNYAGYETADHIAPAWSPTADLIAFHLLEEGFRLVVMEADGSDMRELAEWSLAGEHYEPGSQEPPQWSPDGKRLLFSAASARGDSDIFAVNVDGTGLTNLTNFPGADREAVWSHDGKLIAFASNREGNWEIYVMNADGSNVRNVSNRPISPEMNPNWRP